MAPQQERARRTRAAIVESAAAEFSKRGYAAASINTILEHSNATKGAMYFHFDSKEALARAVLEEGLARYRALVDRWVQAPGLDAGLALGLEGRRPAGARDCHAAGRFGRIRLGAVCGGTLSLPQGAQYRRGTEKLKA